VSWEDVDCVPVITGGIQGATQSIAICVGLGRVYGNWSVTVRRTTMDIRRMLKSVACTVNCPMKAFAVQAGPGTSPLPLEMAYSAKPPETVLFRELIRSVVEMSVVDKINIECFGNLTREQ
jgi:hypothetical protein